jgi:hypothetical protein
VSSTGSFERTGCLVQRNRRLGQVVPRRPAGLTGHQWSAASRAQLDFVVCDGATGAPAFAVMFADPTAGDHADRAIDAVCGAVELGLLRIESPTLRAEAHGRKIIEYVLDARDFAARDGDGGPAPNYREIVGRLPGGRDGFVNDLGALARAAAIEAYAGRQLADPLLRGLRVRWRSGPAEGWGWLDVRGGRCLHERVVLHARRVSCGLELDRLAEDLAALAVGERLRALDAGEKPLYDKRLLADDLRRLRQRRADMVDPAHVDLAFALMN